MDRKYYTFDWPAISFLIEKDSFNDSVLPQEFRYAITQEPHQKFWDKLKHFFK